MMPSRFFLIGSLLFVALAWGPSAAHLLELPAKIGLPREDYLAVQQIYRGWALLGFVVLGELIFTGGFAWTSRGTSWFRYAIAAFACILAAQLLFWLFTFPANKATVDWTRLPAGWEDLRARWEYSHAVAAGFNLAAFGSLLAAAWRMIGDRG